MDTHSIDTALIIVDLQFDFCMGGALEVPNGESIVSTVNALIPNFQHILASKDWHPANHTAFAANHPWRKPGQTIEWKGHSQTLSIIHCVQESFGAEFYSKLQAEAIQKVFFKGTHPDFDSHSAFFDAYRGMDTGLNDYLQAHSIKKLYLAGLSLDDAVLKTAKDGEALGYEVTIIIDATRANSEEDQANALQELKELDIQVTESQLIIKG
ncbi:MAG: bifunctional nicotinamidase/pyrazinamidase [Bacteroidota bacterium]